MRIPSGVTDQYIYFVAVDSTDYASRETGLSSFTVYRSRNGGAPSAMTTPTINETDTTNMPGVYELLLDEDMTIDSGDDSQEMVFHITHAGMAPVTRTIELYRPKITAGNTLDVTATGAAGIDWGNVENQSTSVDLSATSTNLVDTATAVTNDVGVNEWNGVSLGTTNPLPNAAAGAAGGLPTDSSGKTSFNDLSAAQVNSEVDSAIETYGLDHLISASVAGTDVADNSIIAQMVASGATADWDTFVNTTDSLQASRDKLTDIETDTAEIGAAGAGLTNLGGSGNNWNVGKTGYTLTATTGLGDQTANITGTITTATNVTNGVTLANGAVTNASLAGNMEIVYETDFATNYNATRNAWATNVEDTVGSGNLPADMIAISTSTNAADNLEASALGIIPGTAQTGTLNTTTMTSDLTGYADEELIGRVVVWTGGTAAGQASTITDYASASGTVTYNTITTAPVNNDTFVIV